MNREMFVPEEMKKLRPTTMFSEERWIAFDDAVVKGIEHTAPLLKEIKDVLDITDLPTPMVLTQKYEEPSTKLFNMVSTPLPFTHFDIDTVDDVTCEVAGRRIGECLWDYCLTVLRNVASSAPDADKSSHALSSIGYNGPYCVWPSERLAFQNTPDSVRLVVAMKPMLVHWYGKFKALTITTVQPRKNNDGHYGVVSWE